MSLNESDLFHVMLYRSKDFDNNMNISILTGTIKFIKDKERFDQPLFIILWNHSYSFIHTLFIFLQGVRCITIRIFALISYIIHVIVYKWLVKYRFCTKFFFYLYIYTPFLCFIKRKLFITLAENWKKSAFKLSMHRSYFTRFRNFVSKYFWRIVGHRN